jgi:ABC-2 type transport system ATP-binding protein
MNRVVLRVNRVSKTFGSFRAVDRLSFTVHENEIVGLLGPNGAGKTTTIQMLLGVLTPSKGDITYFGKNIRTCREEVLEKLNFSSTYTNLPWRLSVKENLMWVSYLYAIKNRKKAVADSIKDFMLEDIAGKSIAQLSAGEKTRVNLAKAFINNPQILLLDEPTASMDPDMALQLRGLILKRKQALNMSIIWTSHNMSEVEEICDRVIFINKGKIIASDSPHMLVRSIEKAQVTLRIRHGFTKAVEFARERTIACQTDKPSITFDMKEQNVADFLQDFGRQGIEYDEITIEKPSLEDYFLEAAKQ